MFRQKLSPSLIFLSSSLLLPVAVQADELNTQQNAANQGLTVVTANRSAMSVDETLASVTVITREDIERSQIRSTEELLRKQANLTVKKDGGKGHGSTVFIRGTNSSHVLVLIDGIKVGSATLGLTSFQHIPVEQIERIEIVKGPRSSLYGSEAIGGVIQIFTRKAGNKPFSPRVFVGAGSDQTTVASFGASGRVDDTGYSVQLAREQTDGYDVKRDRENDKDGYKNLSASVNLSHDINEENRVTFNYLRVSNDLDFDANNQYANHSKGVNEVIGAGFTSQVTGNWETRINVGRSTDTIDSYKSSVLDSKFKNIRNTASWINTLDTTFDTLFMAGVDYQRDKVKSQTNYEKDSRINVGYFLQAQHALGNSAFEASVRLDDNQQFGSHYTGSAAWGYSFDNGTRFHTSYGSAFKAPTFNDLYYTPGGNPKLDPETSKTLEIGLAGAIEAFNWSITWFQTHVDDLIQWDLDPVTYNFTPDNVDKARIKGVELAADTVFFDWVIKADLSLIDPENRGSRFDGEDLIYRPSQSFTLNMDRDFDKFSTGLTLVAQNEQSYEDYSVWPSELDTIEGFVTVDLRAGYKLTNDITLQTKVENLFEADYETSKDFRQPGLTYLVSLTYQP